MQFHQYMPSRESVAKKPPPIIDAATAKLSVFSAVFNHDEREERIDYFIRYGLEEHGFKPRESCEECRQSGSKHCRQFKESYQNTYDGADVTYSRYNTDGISCSFA
jgi:hypothetical protein